MVNNPEGVLVGMFYLLQGEDNICLMCSSLNCHLYMFVATSTLPSQLCGCGLLTSVLVAEHQSESSDNTAWAAVLVHVGSYFCTTRLVMRLWFSDLCTGFWIDSG